jgi:acyl-coenzyme A thioesterase PaaI-like protein
MYKLDLNLLKILPFANHVGIKSKDNRQLKLENHPHVHNHVGTLHAAAQFTLAETQSGLFLLSLFPEHVNEIAPLLRGSTVKYKNPAQTDLTAIATVSESDKIKCEKQFLKRGRAILSIDVELKDKHGVVTMIGTFVWYIQKSECSVFAS